jgi:hypothetical protein
MYLPIFDDLMCHSLCGLKVRNKGISLPPQFLWVPFHIFSNRQIARKTEQVLPKKDAICMYVDKRPTGSN